MVTKTLHPSDPMSRHPGALAAVQKELDDLRSHPAWDEANPVEADELAKTQPEAHVARVFPIIGIKNFEDPSNHVWKGRIVFAGNRVKTATGQWAMFQDMGAVPSTMAACRAILAAYTAVKGSQLFQSDCVKAYVQALMSGTPTYIRLPKAWWPAHWVGKFRDPLCKLLRALYGHPDAGNLWADKIGDELKRLQFVEPEGWTATYVLNADDSHVAVFVLYVDDLVMYGTGRVLEIVEKVRKNIKMDDPTDLKKYLGVVHRIIRTEVDGETLTHVTFDMEQYFRSAIDDYLNLSGTTLSKVASPFAPRVDGEALARLTSEAGEMAEHAAHCVMKLMYGARMALPYLCVIISRLSSQISRWTKDSDRRLHRVYCYLDHSLDVKLRGSLSTADIDSLKLVAWPDADLNGDAQDTKSTSGYYLELIGNHGRGMPLAWGGQETGEHGRPHRRSGGGEHVDMRAQRGHPDADATRDDLQAPDRLRGPRGQRRRDRGGDQGILAHDASSLEDAEGVPRHAARDLREGAGRGRGQDQARQGGDVGAPRRRLHEGARVS